MLMLWCVTRNLDCSGGANNPDVDFSSTRAAEVP